jgi:hypothetical protein
MNETLDEKQEDDHVHIIESMEMCILCTSIHTVYITPVYTYMCIVCVMVPCSF